MIQLANNIIILTLKDVNVILSLKTIKNKNEWRKINER